MVVDAPDTEDRFGRTVWPRTRCDYFTARCRHKPSISNVLQRVVEIVENSRWHLCSLTTRC